MFSANRKASEFACYSGIDNEFLQVNNKEKERKNTIT